MNWVYFSSKIQYFYFFPWQIMAIRFPEKYLINKHIIAVKIFFKTVNEIHKKDFFMS